MFFRILRHLLPTGRAWRATTDKTLRRFLVGVVDFTTGIREAVDLVWLDLFPETTREVSAWEEAFGLRDTALTETERRDRLLAAWQALGGQDPRYIQDTLQANGFNVFVHEWWAPGTEPAVGVKSCVTPRSPLMYIRREYTNVVLQVECGEALAQCGEAFAECGNQLEPRGYPLVNKVRYVTQDYFAACGEASAQCGETEATCGNYLSFVEALYPYTVPLDSTKWPYFLYIGAETFGDIAQIDPPRKDEFEALCLKICPTHLWLGILVEYA